MELVLSTEVASPYKSNSQRIRVMTEDWVNRSIFCPNCGSDLKNFENNRPVADFYCEQCSEEFELKAKQGVLGNKLVDGAYSSMMERLLANNNPNLFFLTYDQPSLNIKNFMAIPRYFFVPDIIEKRPPLSKTARRAGWIGCNLIMKNIPDFGKIYYVHDGIKKGKIEVLDKWNRTEFVKHTHDIEARGWLLDVLICVDRINKLEFSLEELYNFEKYLKEKHPSNNNIQAKIRQQLQFLRDKHIIEFLGHGKYRLKISSG